MDSIGYQFLVDSFALDVCEPCLRSFRGAGSVASVRRDGWREERVVPARMAPKDDSWQSHLAFALKHEGVNLEILKAFFAAVPESELRDFVLSRRTGRTCRRTGFFYEWLTGRRLDIPDLGTGNYVPAVDGTMQLALPDTAARRAPRFRILDNLPGTPSFCPLLRFTPALRRLSSETLRREADALIAGYPPELLYRAVNYLYVKETKSSFEIERETPGQRRMEDFVALLRETPAPRWDEQWFVSLQRRVVDPRYADSGWRKTQVYVGQTLAPGQERVHYVAPRADDLPGLMDGWLDSASRLLAAPGPDSVALAAAISFAFVFLHPFDDGNGRIHRFLLHDVLRRSGFTPEGAVLPVSAVLLRHPVLYDRMLESVSSRIMPRLRWTMDDRGEVSVRGDPADLYRYIDFTFVAENFAEVVGETIRTEWKTELDFLRNYDRARERMRDVVDLPDRKADLFFRLVVQNGGRLSSRKRDFFAELSDGEVAALEAACRP
ncbi:MAG: Fic family protein [Kiritimatiellae bacterium]|nr:Fic family protein [Kiritimatiellia bacterium]